MTPQSQHRRLAASTQSPPAKIRLGHEDLFPARAERPLSFRSGDIRRDAQEGARLAARIRSRRAA
jgi:hypothetical protein